MIIFDNITNHYCMMIEEEFLHSAGCHKRFFPAGEVIEKFDLCRSAYWQIAKGYLKLEVSNN